MIIGMKTQTRRIWKSRHVRVGRTYAVTHKMMYAPEDIVGYITVTSVEKMPLDVMTAQDAYDEGGYDLPSYFNVISDISGEQRTYKPIVGTTPVWVVKFTFRLSDNIDPNGGDCTKLTYYREWVEHMKKYETYPPMGDTEWIRRWEVQPIPERD